MYRSTTHIAKIMTNRTTFLFLFAEVNSAIIAVSGIARVTCLDAECDELHGGS